MKKILILLVVILLTGCSFNKENISNSKINHNSGIIAEQTMNNLTMSDVLLSYQDGISTFQVTVKNNSKEEVTVNQFDVVFKTENGSMITTLHGALGDTLTGENSITVTITSDIDLSEAYSLEYQIN
ncbi:hypothetical protein EGP64_03300 [bacterium]|nr:hypothetical protein [bacterium]